jgi:protein Tex
MTNYAPSIAAQLGIQRKNVEAVVELLDSGATLPFIARYRKEATGSLDEVQIADIQSLMKKMADLDKRRTAILESIEEQGKLTPELKKAIENAPSMTELEDLYLPYKQKRKTRGSMAIEKGLEPLATTIFAQKNEKISVFAATFLNEKVPSISDALQGARDIIAEWMAEDKLARDRVRHRFTRDSFIAAKLTRGKSEEDAAKYKDYFAWSEPLKNCPSHRLLAMRRGEDEGFLRVSIEPEDAESVVLDLDRQFVLAKNECASEVELAVRDAYNRLLQPQIETEFRNSSKEKADVEAIRVFTENLKQLLLAAPLGQKNILALDPGFRSGCKLVILDRQGNLLKNINIYPHPPQSQVVESQGVIEDFVKKFDIEAIAVGNGTAGRETLDFLQHCNFGKPVEIFQVNEAGASIYSASDVAREEFPDHDVTVRGSVSIGRRLMDPLAELVKIDAKSIGVGQYQHDVAQNLLRESLDRTVESCVNSVGINLNTASKHLLNYVSGLGPTLAQNIVKFRAENGPFARREDLKKVPRMGDKAFEQCAGFLRIRDAKNPLDNTAVHPESYSIVEKMAKDAGFAIAELLKNAPARKAIDLKKYVSPTVGLPTLNDILNELEKPGLDPRGAPKPVEFSNVRSLEDLSVGMILTGIVTNIAAFGAFIDLGIKDSGLVHVSQMANRFIKDPSTVVKLNQQVTVRVVEIDFKRRRVALSMKDI